MDSVLSPEDRDCFEILEGFRIGRSTLYRTGEYEMHYGRFEVDESGISDVFVMIHDGKKAGYAVRFGVSARVWLLPECRGQGILSHWLVGCRDKAWPDVDVLHGDKDMFMAEIGMRKLLEERGIDIVEGAVS